MQITPDASALTWLELLARLWQPLAILLALVAIAVEARVRKLVDARAKAAEVEAESKLLAAVLERAEQKIRKSLANRVEEETNAIRYELERGIQEDIEKLRRDMQIPIGNLGVDNMKTEKRLVELETKMDVFWRTFTRNAAQLMRQSEDERK